MCVCVGGGLSQHDAEDGLRCKEAGTKQGGCVCFGGGSPSMMLRMAFKEAGRGGGAGQLVRLTWR